MFIVNCSLTILLVMDLEKRRKAKQGTNLLCRCEWKKATAVKGQAAEKNKQPTTTAYDKWRVERDNIMILLSLFCFPYDWLK